MFFSRSVRSGMAIGGAAFLALATAAPSTAAPLSDPAVGCGQTITRSTVLVADIVGCPGDGIVVQADNVTVNLNGHKVSGVGARGNSSAGVRLKDRHRVTVTNGTVTGFDAGVVVIGGAANTFRALDVHDNIGAPSLSADLGDGFFLMSTAECPPPTT